MTFFIYTGYVASRGMICDFEILWREVGVAYFKVLSKHFSRDTE